MKDRKFSKRSIGNLTGVHPHLQVVTARALQISPVDFLVIDGLRTREQQKLYVSQGKSKTMNSAHLTGYAVDLVPLDSEGGIDWDKFGPFELVAGAMMQASKEFDVPLRWGGDWDRDGDHKDERFRDGPHFELDRPAYDWSAPHPSVPRSEWPVVLAELLDIPEVADQSPAANRRDLHARRKYGQA